MSRAQRLTFLAVAAVIAAVAVVVLSSGSGDEEDSASTSAQATATPTADATPDADATPAGTPTPTPTPPPLLSAGKVTKLRVQQGDTARFRVRSATPEEIHVHVYDIEKAIAPGRTASVAFRADITGIFEIELHASGEQIGQLRVDPE